MSQNSNQNLENKYVRRLGVLRRIILKDLDQMILDSSDFDNDLATQLIDTKRYLLRLCLDKPNNKYYYVLEMMKISINYAKENFFIKSKLTDKYDVKEINAVGISNAFYIFILCKLILIGSSLVPIKNVLTTDKNRKNVTRFNVPPINTLLNYFPSLNTLISTTKNHNSSFETSLYNLSQDFVKLIEPILENNNAVLDIKVVKENIKEMVKYNKPNLDKTIVYKDEIGNNIKINAIKKGYKISVKTKNSNIFKLEDKYVNINNINTYVNNFKVLCSIKTKKESMEDIYNADVYYVKSKKDGELEIIEFNFIIPSVKGFHFKNIKLNENNTFNLYIGVVNSKGNYPNSTLINDKKDELHIQDIDYRTFTGIKIVENVKLSELFNL